MGEPDVDEDHDIRPRRKRSPLMVLVGLVFMAFGTGFLWSIASDELRLHLRVKDWVEAPATLLEVSGDPRRIGARYRYRLGGREFTGSRIGFYDAWTGGEFSERKVANYQKLRDRLSAAGAAFSQPAGPRGPHVLRATGDGAPFSVWVDPADPGSAVIDPTVTLDRYLPMALFCAGFALLGLAIAAAGLIGLRVGEADGNAAGFHRPHVIRGSSRRFPTFLWLVSLAVIVIAAINSFPFRPTRGNEFVAVVVLTGLWLLGAALLWGAAVSSLRWLRYRGIALYLDPWPGRVGGIVAGSLVAPVPYGPAYRFTGVLQCTEHGVEGGELRAGSATSGMYAREVFRANVPVRAIPDPQGTRLQFSVPIPADAPASNGYGETMRWTQLNARRIYVQWTLHFAGEVDGADLEESFEIPVRRVASGAQAGPVPAAMAGSPAAGGPTVATRPTAEILSGRTTAARSEAPAYRYRRTGNRIRVEQPAWRKPVATESFTDRLLVFGVPSFLLVVGVGLLVQGLWFIVPGLLFVGLSGWNLLATLGYSGVSLVVEVDDRGVAIERVTLGRRRRIALPREGIVAASVAANAPRHPSGSRLSYEVRLETRDGNRHVIADAITDEAQALALRNLVSSRLGVPGGASSSVAPETQRPPPKPPGQIAKEFALSALLMLGLLGTMWYMMSGR